MKPLRPRVALVAGPHRAIRTRFAGPTDTRGSRVLCTVLGSGKRFVIPWDHSLGLVENHDRAAIEACVRMEWAGVLRGARESGGGYVYVLEWEGTDHDE